MTCKRRDDKDNPGLWAMLRNRWGKQINRRRAFDAERLSMPVPLPVDPPDDPPDDPCWYEQLMVWEQEDVDNDLAAQKADSEALLELKRKALNDCRGMIA